MIKTIITTLITSAFAFASFAQNVNIPDPNFKATLLANTNINTLDDGEISLDEATAFNGILNIENKGVADFTGIENFVNITEFISTYNTITYLDLTNNTKLTKITLERNYQLDSINVSKCILLNELVVTSSKLTKLDVTQNVALTKLLCNLNQLISLDLSNNLNIKIFSSTGNPNLGTVCISKQNTYSWIKDRSTDFWPCYEEVNLLEIENDKDAVDIYYAFFDGYLGNNNGKLEYFELDYAKSDIVIYKQTSFELIKSFRNIDRVYATKNNMQNYALNLANNKKLVRVLIRDSTNIKQIILPNLINSIDCYGCNQRLAEVELSNTTLKSIIISNTIIGDSTLDLTNIVSLDTLVLDSTNVKTIDISKNSNIQYFSAKDANSLDTIYISQAQYLRKNDFVIPANAKIVITDMLTAVENSTVLNFSIFPNPASDNVTVTFTESVSGTVSIIDLHGNVVASKSISGNNTNISTAELASGVYVVKISSDKGVAVKQLVIQ